MKKQKDLDGSQESAEEDKSDDQGSQHSEEEEDEGLTLKGAAQYMKPYQAPKKYNNEERYFKSILKTLDSELEKGTNLKKQKYNLYEEFKKNYQSSGAAFLND